MCIKNSTTPPPTPTPSTAQTLKKKRKKKPQQKQQNTHKDSSSASSSNSSSSSSSLKPLKRRNRTKTRKPKYLSLRLQLSQTQNQPKKTTHQQPNTKTKQQHQNLFLPLHPETDNPEENNVALLFSSDGGATLTGLLEDESTTVTAATSDDGSLSAMTCPALEGLVRKAMRRRRSDEGSEERWVCYSEVVEEKKEMMEEVSSATAAATTSFGSLSLKLDHEGILNAWSDKGSLYVAGEEAPQIVPDLLNQSFLQALPPNVAWDGCGCDVAGNTWKVPEDCGANRMLVKEEMGWKLGQREASVLRYKEKRQNRLFAKRIRYEVRKLNAEKRPRMKGRFVKRE